MMTCLPSQRVLSIASLIPQVVTKSSPLWVDEAKSIITTLGKLRPCLEKHREFFYERLNYKDLSKPHIFLNEEAEKTLCEFYLCCAVSLNATAVDGCDGDSKCLLDVANTTAVDMFEPFLSATRRFIDDYDVLLDGKLQNSGHLATTNLGLFWHHNFLAADSVNYSKIMDTLSLIEDAKPEIPQDILSRMQTVYDRWLAASSMPVKAQIRSILVHSGLLLGASPYSPNK